MASFIASIFLQKPPKLISGVAEGSCDPRESRIAEVVAVMVCPGHFAAAPLQGAMASRATYLDPAVSLESGQDLTCLRHLATLAGASDMLVGYHRSHASGCSQRPGKEASWPT